jgi:hypothetical protein
MNRRVMIGFSAPGRKAWIRCALAAGCAIALASCSSEPGGRTSPWAAFAAPGAKPAPQPVSSSPAPSPAAEDSGPRTPLKPYEASAQCWMKYDKSRMDLDAKAKLVDKCIDDKLKGQGGR